MARHPESEGYLAIWAQWKNAGADRGNLHAAEISAVISGFNEKLQITLEECYLNSGPMQDHIERLGCAEKVISRRLGRADRLLVDFFHLKGQRALESAWMREGLASGARSPGLLMKATEALKFVVPSIIA